MSLPTPAEHWQNPELISPRRPDFGPVDLLRLAYTRGVFTCRWAADSRALYFECNITGRPNIWRVPVTGGWPEQMTFSDEKTALEDPSPDGRWLLYTQDVGGNEKPNLYRLPAQGGEPVQLTHTEGVGYHSIHWTPDGRQILFVAERAAPGRYEVYAMPAAGGEPTRLVEADDRGVVAIARIAPNGRLLALNRTHDWQHLGLSVRDIRTGEERVLMPIPDEGAVYLRAWDPKSERLLVNSNLTPTGMYAPALVDVRTGAITWLRTSKWDVEAYTWSRDGRYVVYAENVAGVHHLFLHDVARDHVRQVPLPPGWVWEVRFAPDSRHFAVLFTAADRPSDVWVVDVETLTPRQVTFSFVGGLRPEMFVQPYVVTYSSFDGTPIAALLYLPPNLERNGRNPAIVHIHGGPAWQSVNRWDRQIAYLVTRGYVIIAPNYRGSTGFGRAFEEANRMDLGGGDLKDVVAAVDFLKATGYVDPKKIAVMGASYGGYLTMMALTKYPDLWAAGVAIVPFVNWFTEYENEDPILQAYDRMMMGDPEENADLWRDRSPIFFVDNIRAPLLLLAGENDIRCPAEETRQVAEALQRKGIPVEVKIYEHEGHVFLRREHQIDALERIARFLARVGLHRER